jgi:hypothetical protein
MFSAINQRMLGTRLEAVGAAEAACNIHCLRVVIVRVCSREFGQNCTLAAN